MFCYSVCSKYKNTHTHARALVLPQDRDTGKSLRSGLPGFIRSQAHPVSRQRDTGIRGRRRSIVGKCTCEEHSQKSQGLIWKTVSTNTCSSFQLGPVKSAWCDFGLSPFFVCACLNNNMNLMYYYYYYYYYNSIKKENLKCYFVGCRTLQMTSVNTIAPSALLCYLGLS